MWGFSRSGRFAGGGSDTPGPGSYDPKRRDELGWHADPKSAFLGGERGLDTSLGSEPELLEEVRKPERASKKPEPKQVPHEGRKFSWATERIHQLLASLDEEKHKHQTVLEEKDREIAAISSKAADQQTAIDRLQQQLEGATDEGYILSAQIAEKDVEIQKLKEALQDLQKVSQQQSDQIAKLSRELEATSEEKYSAINNNWKLKEQIEAERAAAEAQFEESQGVLKAKCDELDRLALELNSTIAKLSQRTTERDTLDSRLQETELKLRDALRHASSAEEARDCNAAEIEAMIHEKCGLVDRCNELQTQLDLTSEERRLFELQTRDLESQLVRQAEQSKRDQDLSNGRIDELLDQHKALMEAKQAADSTGDDLQRQLDDMTKANSESIARIADLQQQLGAVTLAKDAAEANKSELQVELGALSRAKTELEDAVAGMQDQLGAMAEAKEAADAKGAETLLQLQRAVEAKEQLDLKLADLQQELDVMASAKEEAHANRADLQKELELMTDEKVAAQARGADLEQRLDAMTQEKTAAEERGADLQKEL
eukprot:CAMPEP_0177616528 /NCGR_PEP_ID=MMETSP0419_2-20121207/24218_1 /TAXON_ID=582737 /ORGANISM="Tetraselmis sp., Strain GSL018" /LENGTH=544 /DNA_ID=CAMNT_0019114621 /DNA_START=54 /DNA_END=1684 /DNA_ORIENTATION=+